MALRKALLERELSRLGFRKAEAARSKAAAEAASHAQDTSSSHPQADTDGQHAG